MLPAPETHGLGEHLRALEAELLTPATRKDPERLHALLAEEFCEIGASGRMYTKAEILVFLQDEKPAQLVLEDFRWSQLAEGVALVTYVSKRNQEGAPPTEALRSSVWVQGAQGWQMRFHQGTRRP